MRRSLLVAAIGALALVGLVGGAAAPVTAQEGTPAAQEADAVTDETIFSWTIPAETLPTGDAEAIFYRLTLPPGSSLPLLAGPFCGCPGETVAAGVGIEVVEEGAYTVRLDAPFTVVRAGVEEDIATGTETTLGPGDIAFFPNYAAPGELRNTGSDQLSLVGLAILSQEETGTPVPDLPQGVLAEEIGRAVPSDWRRLPQGSITVHLRRLSLPAGAELAPYESAGLETINVVEGRVSLALIPAGETEPSQPLTYSPGRAAPFLSVKPGTQRLITNADDMPASILVLTVSPAGEASGTPASA